MTPMEKQIAQTAGFIRHALRNGIDRLTVGQLSVVLDAADTLAVLVLHEDIQIKEHMSDDEAE